MPRLLTLVAGPARHDLLLGRETDDMLSLFIVGLSLDTNDVENLFASALQRLTRSRMMKGTVSFLAYARRCAHACQPQKVKAVEHLVILTQLTSLQVNHTPTF
jgi:hypothetical protein